MRTTVVIVGAGQAGLAMSQRLSGHGVDHVLLERGTVANAWRTQRWDSLRLLTPNWMTRLPGGHAATGTDPDGYMGAAEVATFLDGYRAAIDAPVLHGVTVTAVRRSTGGFVVESPQGRWEARAVVVATGAAGTPRIPAMATDVPGHVDQLSPIHYRRPSQVDDRPVLVVGASASGVQLAEELTLAGRHVVLAVGDHVRLPRRHRGMDIHWWLDTIGILRDRIEDRPDPARARRLPSLQLVGSASGRTLDLARLQDLGVVLAGRLTGVDLGRARFDESLPGTVATADARMGRLLDRIDAHASAVGLDGELAPAARPAPIRVDAGPRSVDLRGFGTVVWATGLRPDHHWLPPEALDGDGVVDHERGVATMAGLYVLGLPFLRRRNSTFIDGVGADATELADHLVAHLGPAATATPTRRRVATR